MAEALGAVASAIQVAEVGFSLATTLYQYATSIKGAEKEIQKIARDVQLTSRVLERTHQQIKIDVQAQTCTEEAIHDLEEILEGCREAFGEVDGALKRSLKQGVDGKITVSFGERMKWPLRSGRIEVLRANLEKLKTSLTLMLSVLIYGAKMRKNRAKAEVEGGAEEVQIETLVWAKKQAVRRYELLNGDFFETPKESMDESVTPTNGFQINAVRMPSKLPPRLDEKYRSFRLSSAAGDRAVNSALGLCATAVSRLAESIDAAAKEWREYRSLGNDGIFLSLEQMGGAVSQLKRAVKNGDDASAGAPNAPSHLFEQMQMQQMQQAMPQRPTSPPLYNLDADSQLTSKHLGEEYNKKHPERSATNPSRDYELQFSLLERHKEETKLAMAQKEAEEQTSKIKTFEHANTALKRDQRDGVLDHMTFNEIDLASMDPEPTLDNFDFDSFLTARDTNIAGHRPVRIEAQASHNYDSFKAQSGKPVREAVGSFEDSDDKLSDEESDADVVESLLRRWTKLP